MFFSVLEKCVKFMDKDKNFSDASFCNYVLALTPVAAQSVGHVQSRNLTNHPIMVSAHLVLLAVY